MEAATTAISAEGRVGMKSKDGKPIFQPNKQRDITGKKFGKLNALNFEYRDDRYNHFWKFECECGNKIIARKSAVTSGNTKQCKKCASIRMKEINTTHGLSKTRLYREWAGMIQRCELETSTSYDRYGALGISVCEEWHKFEPFAEWSMENGYSDNLTIDRIDSTGNYEPSNCRWVGNLEQANNKCTNVYVEYMGETHTLAEWARIYGMKYHCLYDRWKKGWKTDELFKGYSRTETDLGE